MISLIRWNTLALILLFLSHHLALVVSFQVDCTANDTLLSSILYKSNLYSLLNSLSTNVDSNGFYNTSMGKDPDTAFASVLCRADVLPNDCQNCVRDAAVNLIQSCPDGKQAILWDDKCMLRYSNESMFHILANVPEWSQYSVANASSPVQFMEDVGNLLHNLSIKAPLGGPLGKVAWGSTHTADLQTIFSLLQCSPDLSSPDCSNCLVTGISDITDLCDGKIRCRILKPSCIVRYSTQPFYNETRLQELLTPITTSFMPASAPKSLPPPTPSPPPLPPVKTSSHKNIILVLSIVGGFLLAVCVVGVVCMKKRKKRSITEVTESDHHVIITSDGSINEMKARELHYSTHSGPNVLRVPLESAFVNVTRNHAGPNVFIPQ